MDRPAVDSTDRQGLGRRLPRWAHLAKPIIADTHFGYLFFQGHFGLKSPVPNGNCEVPEVALASGRTDEMAIASRGIFRPDPLAASTVCMH